MPGWVNGVNQWPWSLVKVRLPGYGFSIPRYAESKYESSRTTFVIRGAWGGLTAGSVPDTYGSACTNEETPAPKRVPIIKDIVKRGIRTLLLASAARTTPPTFRCRHVGRNEPTFAPFRFRYR